MLQWHEIPKYITTVIFYHYAWWMFIPLFIYTENKLTSLLIDSLNNPIMLSAKIRNEYRVNCLMSLFIYHAFVLLLESVYLDLNCNHSDGFCSCVANMCDLLPFFITPSFSSSQFSDPAIVSVYDESSFLSASHTVSH